MKPSRTPSSPGWWRWPLASLKGRLLLLAAIVMLAGLGLFALQLSAMFRQHVERSTRATMELQLEQLIVALRRTPEGELDTTALLPEPRFKRPMSGYYWQVSDLHGHVLARSRSLWDATLPPPPSPPPEGGALWFRTQGPGGRQLLVLARRIVLPREMLFGNGGQREPGEVAALFMVAHDRAGVVTALQAFRRDLAISLVALAVVLLLALLAQIWLGLRPLTLLRRQIAAIREGRRQRLDAHGVAEIGGMVEELNKLLRQQQRHMEQARARAGNLAHGLKTPLAALAALARDMLEEGQEEKARAVLHQVALLGRQVQHELSRARVQGDAGQRASTPLRPTIDKLLRTLNTLHGENELRWQVEVPETLAVPLVEGQLLELLGNLLDNAAKWARSTVRIRAHADDDKVEIVVEDDGPGVPADKRADIVKRGVRLDENVPGSGLGLAIVQEIITTCGGDLALEESALGGLRAVVRLPRT